MINQAYWKHGYAKEACAAIIQHAFANGIHRIYAEIAPENMNSWKMAERLGFVREAHFIKNVYFWKDENGCPVWKDTYVYARLSE